MSKQGDVRKMIKSAKKRGWVYQSTKKGHHQLIWKDGRSVVMSLTPSCYHALKNFEADMRRIENSTLDSQEG